MNQTTDHVVRAPFALRSRSSLCIGLIALSLLTACSIPPVIGTAPSATPPRIVIDASNPQKRVWDNPEAFGPVPFNLEGRAQRVCSAMDTREIRYKAIGYHPAAQNINGQTMPDGGFLCVLR
jgi:hypothetical protein